MDCKAPTCQYSKNRNKCIKPNPYIEAISWCRRNKINFNKCKELYNMNKNDSKQKACERYAERINYIPSKIVKKLSDESINKSRTVSMTSKSFNFTKSKSRSRSKSKSKSKSRLRLRSDFVTYKEKGKKKQHIKTIKKYKTRKGKTARIATRKSLKDAFLQDIKQRPELRERVFLKHIIDDGNENKEMQKQLSNIHVLPILSPKSKSISNLSKKIRELQEKYAANKIQKFIMKKIIQRLETLENRLGYFKYINEYLKNTPELLCLKGKKYADKLGNINDGYELGTFLKLVKKIGTESANGIIYKTVAKNVILTLATKIMPMSKDNKYEIRLNQVVTEVIKRRLSKHFLLSYKTYECNQPSIDPAIPKIVHNTKYLITLNELAHGDVKTLCNSQMFLSNNEFIANIALQCLFAIATFHSLGYSHNDCHWGNFLFHVSSKPLDGWYMYSVFDKTFYMKNCGYNIMISDFGMTKEIDRTPINMNRVVGDYVRILHAFITKTDHGWLETYPPSFKMLSTIMLQLKLMLMQCMVKKYDDEQTLNSIIQFYLHRPILNNVISETLPSYDIILNREHAFIITQDIYTKNNVDLKKSYLRKITPKK